MTLHFGDWGAAQAFYQSWGHQPIQSWILQAAFAIWLIAHRKQREWMPLFLFTLTSGLDAWLSASPVPGWGQLSPFSAQWLGIFFVILGDLRFFWFTLPHRPIAVLLLSFAVPVASALVRALPGFPVENLRAVFISYEILFVIWLIALLRWSKRVPALRGFDSARTRRIAGIVFAYYGLWIVADALLLGGASGGLVEVAWSTRILANLLYYGGLMPWVALSRGR